MPSAAAPAALRKPDNSVPRDGGRGEVERRRRRRVINLGCSCVCGSPEAEACPAGHCVGQSPLISSCLFLALWLYKRVSHLITVVCDLTSHVYPPFSPPQRSRISSHFTARFRSHGFLAPVHQKLCLSPAAPSQLPIIFQRFSRSQPKTTFGLRHPLPYHVCCDFDFHALALAQTRLLHG